MLTIGGPRHMGRQMIHKTKRATSLAIDEGLFLQLCSLQQRLGLGSFTEVAHVAFREFVDKHLSHIDIPDSSAHIVAPQKIRFVDEDLPIVQVVDKDEVVRAIQDAEPVEVIPNKSDILEILRKSQG